ncbi:MAG TPA: response regulator [Candidatus Parcubacteria bacterium]|nr:response regulator [Candidatus Parcubacteria bacterium]
MLRFATLMKKILFVEDEPSLQKTLGDVLEQNGYEVISAFDGESGLEKAKSEKPDLILLDIVLPKMDGLKVLEKLKSDEDMKATPVIILTNLERMDEINKAIEMGANAYLVKAQYTMSEVIDKINETLEN